MILLGTFQLRTFYEVLPRQSLNRPFVGTLTGSSRVPQGGYHPCVKLPREYTQSQNVLL